MLLISVESYLPVLLHAQHSLHVIEVLHHLPLVSMLRQADGYAAEHLVIVDELAPLSAHGPEQRLLARLAVVPDDEQIVIATNQGEPLVGTDSLAGKAYMNICHRILGEEVPFMDLTQKTGIIQKLAGLFKKN